MAKLYPFDELWMAPVVSTTHMLNTLFICTLFHSHNFFVLWIRNVTVMLVTSVTYYIANQDLVEHSCKRYVKLLLNPPLATLLFVAG